MTGVGPDMVGHVYPDYRIASAVQANNPHLHNVPMQIAAERGLPALVLWVWFVLTAGIGLWRMRRTRGEMPLAAAGLGALVAMLAAGLFEYNFGDSEFLMLLLVLITLPFAADRDGEPCLDDAGGSCQRSMPHAPGNSIDRFSSTPACWWSAT